GSYRVKILFENAGVKCQFVYEFEEVNLFYFESHIDENLKREYLRNLDNGECVMGKCNNFNNHYNLFVDILDYIIKKNN
ncbi:MAG: hypothetical protein K2I49_01575, partial [Ureaplasma sp.]|nr:hypothetical protein [Ureaplasma sp.]